MRLLLMRGAPKSNQFATHHVGLQERIMDSAYRPKKQLEKENLKQLHVTLTAE